VDASCSRLPYMHVALRHYGHDCLLHAALAAQLQQALVLCSQIACRGAPNAKRSQLLPSSGSVISADSFEAIITIEEERLPMYYDM
jgi:hypothetical protein